MSGVSFVVGGGISGLVAALLLAERYKQQVVLIEKDSTVGGLLRCFDYGDAGCFDYGMHNMYETGIDDLDALLFGLLPENEWQFLDGHKRDLAGLFFRNKLQRHSPFPDLRSLPPDDLDKCISGFFRQIDDGPGLDEANAYRYAVSRFGAAVADRVIAPAIEKQFGHPADKMDVLATMFTTMSRVVMFGEHAFRNLMDSDLLRDRLAFPEQRNLPSDKASGRRAYYPKKYGIYRVIDSLSARLKVAGVSVLTNSQIQRVHLDSDRIARLDVSNAGNVMEISGVNQLIWTTGLPALAPLLNIDLRQLGFDRPQKTIVVNLLLREPPDMGDLYYFYCFDPGYRTFRVTNFGAYCDGAVRNGGHPVAVELLIGEPGVDKDNLTKIAIDELVAFGVLKSETDVAFARAEILTSGFPMPTSRNTFALRQMRQAIRSMNISNLMLLGVLSEDRIFFQRDVLEQTYTKIVRGHLNS